MEQNLPVSDGWLHIFYFNFPYLSSIHEKGIVSLCLNFREMRKKHLDFQEFCNVVGFTLCLPGSTAPVERIFFVMNSIAYGQRRN